MNWPLGDKLPLDLTEPASADALPPVSPPPAVSSPLPAGDGLSGLRWRLPFLLLDALFAARGAPPAAEALANSPRAVEIIGSLRRRLEAGAKNKYITSTPHLLLLSTEFYTSELRPVLAGWAALVLGTLRLRCISEREIVGYLEEGRAPRDTEGRMTRRERQVRGVEGNGKGLMGGVVWVERGLGEARGGAG